LRVSSQCVRDFFGNIKIANCRPAFELPELDCLVWLSDHNGVLFILLLISEQPRIILKEFLKYSFSLVRENFLDT
jgi:hypothetical protein